jgi:hypothetical protein
VLRGGTDPRARRVVLSLGAAAIAGTWAWRRLG